MRGKIDRLRVCFAQELRPGFGMFSGGDRDLLDRSMRQIGRGVAGLIRAF